MLTSFKSAFRAALFNHIGLKTTQKIVVIESDDWGSIRMHSRDSKNFLKKRGFQVEQCPYNCFDALECNEDVEKLIDTLFSIKNCDGNHPVVTANFISANPDFKKIMESDFSEYFYEPFTVSLDSYPCHNRVFELHNSGVALGVIYPQFHGREHVNVRRWMRALRNGEAVSREAFRHNMFTVHNTGKPAGRREFLDAFGGSSIDEISSYSTIVREGLGIFEDKWKIRPSSFIPPCYTWPVELEAMLFEMGINTIQGAFVQRVPVSDVDLSIRRKYHYSGQRNSFGQVYFTRNCSFEPSERPGKDCVDECLREVAQAFRARTPAIISMHRMNVVGFIEPANRDRNLILFRNLLKRIINKYPDTKFLSTAALRKMIDTRVH